MMESLQNILSLESLVHPAVITTLSLLVVLLYFLHWRGTRGFADLKKLNVPHIAKAVPFLGNFLEARKYNGMHLLYLDYVNLVRLQRQQYVLVYSDYINFFIFCFQQNFCNF